MKSIYSMFYTELKSMRLRLLALSDLSRGSEKYLCEIWINCFYYDIPVLTITCECVGNLDSILKAFSAMTQESESTFYYKDFKFSKNDIYYINTLVTKKDLFKSIFESDEYKIERFL